MSFSYITDDGLEQFCKACSLQLYRLDMMYCRGISDGGLQHLSHLSELSYLKVTWCQHITDDGLEHLAKLTSLRDLQMRFCKRVTPLAVEELRKKLPNTTIVHSVSKSAE